MECLKCGEVMEEQIKRIKLLHPFGKKFNTLKDKTALRRTYYCKSCDVRFIVSKTLVEVELA